MGLKSRSKQYRARQLHLKLKNVKKGVRPARKARERSAEPKVVSLYPERHALASRRKVQHVSKPRASLVPGAVLILLAGKFQGKRVVLLDVLPSGLLLVSGPYRLNGVPLRRVNPAYVIATSTKVDVAQLKLKDEYKQDAFYRNAAKAEKKKVPVKKAGEEAFFAANKKTKAPLSAAVQAAQKEVDAQLLTAIKKVPLLAAYLKKPFSLSNGDKPHLMKF